MVPFPTPALERFAAELTAAAGAQERSRLLLGYARQLAPLPEAARTDANRVMGCTAQVGRRASICLCSAAAAAARVGAAGSTLHAARFALFSSVRLRHPCRRPALPPTLQVWVSAQLDAAGRVQFAADSDAELTRGLAALLVQGLSGLTPDEVLQVRIAVGGAWVREEAVAQPLQCRHSNKLQLKGTAAAAARPTG